MSEPSPSTTRAAARIEVTARDLPLHCPMQRTPLWSAHPRVYLALTTGAAKCPYCGTIYTYNGVPPKGH